MTPETGKSLQHGWNHQFQRKHRVGNPGQHSFQVLEREHQTHDIEPGTKTGDLRNALAMEMESTN